MAILGRQSDYSAQLIITSVCVILFSLIVALVSRASLQETMAASAAYAAVLVVFISTNHSNINT